MYIQKRTATRQPLGTTLQWHKQEKKQISFKNPSIHFTGLKITGLDSVHGNIWVPFIIITLTERYKDGIVTY